MRLENRLALRLTIGSEATAISANGTFWMKRMTITEAIVRRLAIVRGTMTTSWLICWRSVAPRAMSWPVCAWS